MYYLPHAFQDALSVRSPVTDSGRQGPPIDASLAALKAFNDLYTPEDERRPWGEVGIEKLEAWQHFGRGYLAARGWRLIEDEVLGPWWAYTGE